MAFDPEEYQKDSEEYWDRHFEIEEQREQTNFQPTDSDSDCFGIAPVQLADKMRNGSVG